MGKEKKGTLDTRSDFIKSLDQLTPDDIAPSASKKTQTGADTFSKLLRNAVLIFCAAVFVMASKEVVESLIGYGQADKIYGDIQQEILGDTYMNKGEEMLQSPANPPTPDYEEAGKLSADDLDSIIKPPAVDPELERMKIKLYDLRLQYPNLYGWITIPGTNINYPIMQATDNDYYLNHSYTGSYLEAGAIFADFRNSKNVLDNFNLIIYGHHMANNSMFHALDNYQREDFFRKYNTIYIYTPEGKYTYKVFSVYITDKYFPYIPTEFATYSEVKEFADRMHSVSMHKLDDWKFDPFKQNVLTLSTCNNTIKDGRLPVHAYLESYIE